MSSEKQDELTGKLMTKTSIEFHRKGYFTSHGKTNLQYYGRTNFKWKRTCIGKTNIKVRHFCFVKIFFLLFLRPKFSPKHYFPLLIISWRLLFLNGLGNVTQIFLLCSARHIVNKICNLSSGWNPTHNNNTLLEAFRIIAMNMTHFLLLVTSSLKTLFQLEDFVICLWAN